MNMFSGKNEKNIPKKLSECTQTDSTVANLHLWAERLERLGGILLGILIIIGIMTTVVEAIAIAEIDEDLILSTVATSVATWGIYAFIAYCAYHVLALLISALATITQNTIVSANVALYEASKTDPAPSISPATAANPNIRANRGSVPDGMWACNNCGTYNKDAHGQCKGCGQYRSR